MSDSSVVFRIKMGEVEVEYQGELAFLKSQFLETTKEVLDLYASRRAIIPETQRQASKSDVEIGKSLDLSTDTIATVLNANSGPDLLIAASANLQFVRGKPKFSRQELITEMRTAPNHFKETFVNNLSQYLGRLTKADRLRSVGGDMYALSSKEKSDLEAKLANA